MAGGGDTSTGIYYVANMPTEEVFTSPDARRTEGTIRSSLPLVLSGQIVRELELTFEQGRAVRVEAETGADLVRSHFATIENADRLGEVALVTKESRVGQIGDALPRHALRRERDLPHRLRRRLPLPLRRRSRGRAQRREHARRLHGRRARARGGRGARRRDRGAADPRTRSGSSRERQRERLERYAELAVRVGANVQAGTGGLRLPDGGARGARARAHVRQSYEAGASYVHLLVPR